jgi:hypothetical protein
MKKHPTTVQHPSATASDRKPANTVRHRIHPVIIYPIRQPEDYSDLAELYELAAKLGSQKSRYARPITVMDRKTHWSMQGNSAFRDFRKRTVARHSELLDAWCVDTCQMWYSGLGRAFEQGGPHDVYWLIPGDFNYGSAGGREVLGRLHDLPEIILELGQDLCIGEIEADHNNSKQIIDTYGTFALLYTWFPAEAEEIRRFTERPRSEFFAVCHNFLRELLERRWYAYEQTMVMLLQAVTGRKRLSRFFVGQISDLPDGGESLTSALQQVERTERVLRSLWRERHQAEGDWLARYRQLEAQSEQVRRTASTILENLLGK